MDLPRKPIQVIHHLPRHRHHGSRTRIKVSRSAVEKLARHIHNYPEVTCVETNDVTGSILVHHQNSLDDLIAQLEAEGITDVLGLPEGVSEVLAGLGPRILTLALALAVIFVVGPRWLSV